MHKIVFSLWKCRKAETLCKEAKSFLPLEKVQTILVPTIIVAVVETGQVPKFCDIFHQGWQKHDFV